jgi:protein-disulfide reductase (glutathione)
MSKLFIFATICIIAFISTAFAKPFDKIKWFTSIDSATDAAAENGKPLMVLITKEYCGACKNLKASFAKDTSDKFDEAAENFNIVHLADDAEPKSAGFRPDGGYIPRTIFADVNGKPLPEIKQTTRQQHQYFYHDVNSLTTAMNSAAKTLGQ